MNWVDIGIIVTLALAAISGWRAGLIPGAFLLGGAAVGMALSHNYATPLGRLLIGTHAHAWLLGLVLIIGAGSIAGLIISAIVQRMAHALWLGWADRIGGVVMGLAIGVVILGTLFAVAGRSSGTPAWAAHGIHRSSLAPTIEGNASIIRSSLPRSV